VTLWQTLLAVFCQKVRSQLMAGICFYRFVCPLPLRWTRIFSQDITAGFERPCILDIKIGRRQWGEDAPPEKMRFECYMIRTRHVFFALQIAFLARPYDHLKLLGLTTLWDAGRTFLHFASKFFMR